MNDLNRQILGLTLPSVVSNVTVPLLSLVDNSIVGHMGSPLYIGAVAMGATILNMIYWVFAFLRMGTTGLTAQAKGKGSDNLMKGILLQSVRLSLIISLLILFFQKPIFDLSVFMLEPDLALRQELSTYYTICIWGAPAMLMQYSLTGWMIGAQDTKSPMFVAIFQNIVNIAVSLILVYLLEWKISGVATGTLVATWAGLLLSLLLIYRHQHLRALPQGKAHLSLSRFFSINLDLFLRTVCLILVTVSFTKYSNSQGPMILAANTLLLQFFMFYSYLTDGLANAAEAISGHYHGVNDTTELSRTIRYFFLWGLGISMLFTMLYYIGGNGIIGLLTNIPSVRTLAGQYMLWACLIPFLSLPAMVWDGVFIGMTYTKEMLMSMLTAMLVFFLMYHTTLSCWGNHALWMAFLSYLFTRGLVQTWLFYRKRRTKRV